MMMMLSVRSVSIGVENEMCERVVIQTLTYRVEPTQYANEVFR